MIPNEEMSYVEFCSLEFIPHNDLDANFVEMLNVIALHKHPSDQAVVVSDIKNLVSVVYKGMRYITFGSPIIRTGRIVDPIYYTYWWYHPYKAIKKYPKRAV